MHTYWWASVCVCVCCLCRQTNWIGMFCSIWNGITFGRLKQKHISNRQQIHSSSALVRLTRAYQKYELLLRISGRKQCDTKAPPNPSYIDRFTEPHLIHPIQPYNVVLSSRISRFARANSILLHYFSCSASTASCSLIPCGGGGASCGIHFLPHRFQGGVEHPMTGTT